MGRRPGGGEPQSRLFCQGPIPGKLQDLSLSPHCLSPDIPVDEDDCLLLLWNKRADVGGGAMPSPGVEFGFLGGGVIWENSFPGFRQHLQALSPWLARPCLLSSLQLAQARGWAAPCAPGAPLWAPAASLAPLGVSPLGVSPLQASWVPQMSLWRQLLSDLEPRPES